MSERENRLIIAIATDSFKGTLSSLQAATCIEKGLKRVLRNIVVRKIPMADGGEGTARTVVEAAGGRMVHCLASDPLGRRIRAAFGLIRNGRTAVIEMATASGLVRLQPDERNPLKASTRGTGELIRRALDKGALNILVGIGGSATNDGGTGMARALGVRFLDGNGRDLPEGGEALGRLKSIDMSKLDYRLAGTVVDVACDVTNPLTGKSGATQVYGPQKGATPAMVDTLDHALGNLALVIKRDIGISILRVPGGGAAGGLGAGLMAFCGARLRPGIDIVMEAVGLERRLRGCHLVITGEGGMDAQTLNGKTPAGVARIAKSLGIPVIAIAGRTAADAYRVHDAGIDAFFSAQKHNIRDDQLVRKGPPALIECAEEVARLLRIGSQLPTL